MKIVYTGYETKDEMITRALEGLSRAERAYERNHALLLRCKDEAEAGRYASALGKLSLMVERAFMETAEMAISADRGPHEVDTWKDGVPGEMDMDEYISRAMVLISGKEAAGPAHDCFRLERHRADFIARMVFGAVSRIRREAYELMKLDLFRTPGDMETDIKREKERIRHMRRIRSLFSAVSCCIQNFRDYITSLEECMPVRECEERMYAMMEARVCAMNALEECTNSVCRSSEREAAGSGISVSFGIFHLDGETELFDTERSAARAMSEDLYHLSLLSADAEHEFLFAAAADILRAVGEDAAFSREEAEKCAGDLEYEADMRWPFPADDNIRMVLNDASYQIRKFSFE